MSSTMLVREDNVAELPFIFESKDVIRLVGIPSVLLNKFVEKTVCGIKPSIRTGVGKGSRRLFSSQDLYAIALVWWLFQAGFRSQVLREIVRDISKGKSPSAYSAEMIVMLETNRNGRPFLLVKRELQKTKGTSKAKHSIEWVSSTREALARMEVGCVLHVLPVGNLQSELVRKAQQLKPMSGVR